MSNLLSRRTFLQRAPIAAAAVASTSAIVCAEVVAAAEPAPTEEEIALYYSFLWCEFRALSEELGVEMFDCLTLWNVKGYDRYQAAFADTAPSSRARLVKLPEVAS